MNSPLFKVALARPREVSAAGAFSLVEMLAVVAIVSVLATMVAPSISSVFNGKNSSRALDVLTSSATVARQTAMSSGSPVALVVNRSARSSVDSTQAVLILQAPGDATVLQDNPDNTASVWTPKGNWTRVPSNVEVAVFKRDGATSFYDAASGGPLNGTLPVKFEGKPVTDYDYIVFYSDGSVDAPASGPALTFRRLTSAADAVDFKMVVQSNSGRVKILQ